MVSPQAALIYTMVLVSASDQDMTDAEMMTIGDIVRHLPVFADYNHDLLPTTAAACADMLSNDDGLDDCIALIRAALPPKLRETAYALACEVAASDGEVHQEELQVLEMLRHQLNLDRLIAAAIERGTRARYTHL